MEVRYRFREIEDSRGGSAWVQVQVQVQVQVHLAREQIVPDAALSTTSK